MMLRRSSVLQTSASATRRTRIVITRNMWPYKIVDQLTSELRDGTVCILLVPCLRYSTAMLNQA